MTEHTIFIVIAILAVSQIVLLVRTSRLQQQCDFFLESSIRQGNTLHGSAEAVNKFMAAQNSIDQSHATTLDCHTELIQSLLARADNLEQFNRIANPNLARVRPFE